MAVSPREVPGGAGRGGFGAATQYGKGGKAPNVASKIVKKIKDKDVSKVGSKVKLEKEPSSVTFIQTGRGMWGDEAAKANLGVATRASLEAAARSSKSALKAANKTPKLSKDAKAFKAEANRLAIKRAQEAMKKYQAGKGPALNAAQRLVWRKNLPPLK